MSDWGKFKGRPSLGWCLHRATVSTVTAGLERIVCEKCGDVRVRYVGETVKIYPEPGELAVRSAAPGGGAAGCVSCDAKAEYMIPSGLACAAHAWAEATRQDELGFELWIPIRIDHNARTSG